MNQNNNNLEAAIARGLREEGSESAQRLNEAIERTTNQYNAGMKKVGRVMAVYLCVLSWLAVMAMYMFGLTVSVKGLIAWGVIFLLAIENTILIKLWYWIMNTKIDLLKELKTLRYEMAGITTSEESATPFTIRNKGLSRREQLAWFLVLVIGGGLIGYVFTSEYGRAFTFSKLPKGEMGSRRTVNLHEDGSATIVTDYSFPNDSLFPMETFSMYSGDQGMNATYTDMKGNEIPYTTRPEREGIRTYLQLPETVKPGDRLLIHEKAETPNGAKKEGGEWFYWSGQSWGYGECQYSETLVFPKGAKVVNTDMKPVGIGAENQDGLPFYEFQGTRRNGGWFGYKLTYRIE